LGRKSSFEPRQVLATAGAQKARTGDFTLDRLIEETGLSSGSLYHRFASREALLAEAWLDALQRFQAAFQVALDGDVEDAILATPRFCRAEPDAASVLACCRKAEFVGPSSPLSIRDNIDQLNTSGEAALRRFSRRIDKPPLSCRLALIAYPLAAVRLYLPDARVPTRLDREILKAGYAALGIE
jgi:AcrR family transcriptional regulator